MCLPQRSSAKNTSESRFPLDGLRERVLKCRYHRQSKGRIVLRQKTNVLQGTLDMLVLKTLSWGPQHGYGIALRIQMLSDDVLKVEEGSLYPALYRLEEQGWIDSEWSASENNRKAKFYKLTAQGRRYLRAEYEAWDRLSTAVSKVMKAAEEPI